MPEPAHGLILAFDFGLRRIGIAAGSALSGSAAPRITVANGDHGPDWAAIDREVRDYAPTLLLVGAPYNVDGTRGRLAESADAFAAALGERYGLDVERIDESYTSLAAEAVLKAGRQAGTRRRVRKGDIDSADAAVLLDSYLSGAAVRAPRDDA